MIGSFILLSHIVLALCNLCFVADHAVKVERHIFVCQRFFCVAGWLAAFTLSNIYIATFLIRIAKFGIRRRYRRHTRTVCLYFGEMACSQMVVFTLEFR